MSGTYVKDFGRMKNNQDEVDDTTIAARRRCDGEGIAIETGDEHVALDVACLLLRIERQLSVGLAVAIMSVDTMPTCLRPSSTALPLLHNSTLLPVPGRNAFLITAISPRFTNTRSPCFGPASMNNILFSRCVLL